MNLEPLRGLTFGANVSGLTMHEINAGDWSRIEVGLADFGLLRLRGQQFDARSVAAFARRFGELEGDIGEARGISNKGEDAAPLDMGDPAWLTRAYPTRYWHADGTFNRVAPRVCVLAGAAIPAAGACTEFADMCAAWDMHGPCAAARTRTAHLLSLEPCRLDPGVASGACLGARVPTASGTGRRVLRPRVPH